ncbi:RPM1 interacting protein 13 [Linum perenne]
MNPAQVANYINLNDEPEPSKDPTAPAPEEDDECLILDGDPYKNGKPATENSAGDEELLVVGETGQVACRDYPHSRHLCIKFPFNTALHFEHCDMCHCYVCDSPAPCKYWGTGFQSKDHCHATDAREWQTKRAYFRRAKPGSSSEAPNTQVPEAQTMADPSQLTHVLASRKSVPRAHRNASKIRLIDAITRANNTLGLRLDIDTCATLLENECSIKYGYIGKPLYNNQLAATIRWLSTTSASDLIARLMAASTLCPRYAIALREWPPMIFLPQPKNRKEMLSSNTGNITHAANATNQLQRFVYHPAGQSRNQVSQSTSAPSAPQVRPQPNVVSNPRPNIAGDIPGTMAQVTPQLNVVSNPPPKIAGDKTGTPPQVTPQPNIVSNPPPNIAGDKPGRPPQVTRQPNVVSNPPPNIAGDEHCSRTLFSLGEGWTLPSNNAAVGSTTNVPKVDGNALLCRIHRPSLAGKWKFPSGEQMRLVFNNVTVGSTSSTSAVPSQPKNAQPYLFGVPLDPDTRQSKVPRLGNHTATGAAASGVFNSNYSNSLDNQDSGNSRLDYYSDCDWHRFSD